MPTLRPRRLAVVALALAMSGAPPARATVVPLATGELARASALVVRGVVEETRARWTLDRSKIVTWAAIRVEEVCRGSHSRRRLVVEVEGGEVGGIGLKVTDVPTLAAGDRVVLFVERATADTGRAIHRVVGDAQGAYRVDPDGIARKDGFHIAGDPSLVDWEIPLADLVRRAKEAK